MITDFILIISDEGNDVKETDRAKLEVCSISETMEQKAASRICIYWIERSEPLLCFKIKLK